MRNAVKTEEIGDYRISIYYDECVSVIRTLKDK